MTRAVAAYPDAEAIFGRNIETLNKLGLAGWRALGLGSAPKKDETPNDRPRDRALPARVSNDRSAMG